MIWGRCDKEERNVWSNKEKKNWSAHTKDVSVWCWYTEACDKGKMCRMCDNSMLLTFFRFDIWWCCRRSRYCRGCGRWGNRRVITGANSCIFKVRIATVRTTLSDISHWMGSKEHRWWGCRFFFYIRKFHAITKRFPSQFYAKKDWHDKGWWYQSDWKNPFRWPKTH